MPAADEGVRTALEARADSSPAASGDVIVVGTLAIPGMILGETALSFLGLGIRPPMVSWGRLLSAAQKMRVLVLQPWLLWPIVPVMVTAIAYNMLGDGLRDAFDPRMKGTF